VFTKALLGLLIIAIPQSLPLDVTGKILSSEARTVSHTVLTANKDDDEAPGKAITDDPHGPSPYGRSPHGRDPHDEVHDKNLPANNPDKYFKEDTAGNTT